MVFISWPIIIRRVMLGTINWSKNFEVVWFDIIVICWILDRSQLRCNFIFLQYYLLLFSGLSNIFHNCCPFKFIALLINKLFFKSEFLLKIALLTIKLNEKTFPKWIISILSNAGLPDGLLCVLKQDQSDSNLWNCQTINFDIIFSLFSLTIHTFSPNHYNCFPVCPI